MLYLISLGLYDENDMSLKALNAAKECDILYAEFYTSNVNTNVERLSKLLGRDVEELSRSDLEEDLEGILSKAEERDVGIVIGGDVLTATTHIEILLSARKRGIKTKIIHGSSVYTAVGECGLQIYKFGKTATVPRFKKGYMPESFYDVILENKKMGLHTLLLLDIGLTLKEGLNTVRATDEKRNKNVLKEKLVVCAKLGSDKPLIKYGFANKLASSLKKETPGVIIIPGKLHFKEKEVLEELYGE
jgi:diphthine synthase